METITNVVAAIYNWFCSIGVTSLFDIVTIFGIYIVSVIGAFNWERRFWFEKGRPGKGFGLFLVCVDSIIPVINTIVFIGFSIRRIVWLIKNKIRKSNVCKCNVCKVTDCTSNPNYIEDGIDD